MVIELSSLILKLSLQYLLIPFELLLMYLWSHRKPILKFLAFLLPLSVTLYFIFIPKINISYSDPLDPQNIFTSRFTINNNGNSSIHNIKLKYKLDKIKAIHPNIRNLEVNNFNMTYERPIYIKIRNNKKQSINLDFSQLLMSIPPGLKTFSAELTIYLEYEYWKFCTKIDSFHFSTSEMINNKIIWLDKQ